MKTLAHWFGQFAKWAARTTGHPTAFGLAVAVIVVWATTGPMFDFSDTWQLVINTSTTIVTFLMVFLIQNTQNRDSGAVQAKLDELIRHQRAHNCAVGSGRARRRGDRAHSPELSPPGSGSPRGNQARAAGHGFARN